MRAQGIQDKQRLQTLRRAPGFTPQNEAKELDICHGASGNKLPEQGPQAKLQAGTPFNVTTHQEPKPLLQVKSNFSK